MKLSRKILFYVVYYLGMMLLKTWRLKYINTEKYDEFCNSGLSPVVAIWHDSLLPLSFSQYGRKAATIASDSKDGDLIAFILNKWGFYAFRGSSTRGGLKAVMGLIKKCKKEPMPAAVTVDGPVGPRHEVKSGAVFIAKNLDKVLFTAHIKTKRYYRFNSWDKFILPKPFAKIDIVFSDPFYVTDDLSENSVKADTERLQDFMIARTKEICPEFL